MISLPKTVTRQRHDCDLNPGHSAPESSTLTTATEPPERQGTKRERKRREVEEELEGEKWQKGYCAATLRLSL